MTMTLAAPSELAPVITPDQLALVKATIARDATDSELQLFIYDCTRRGVHPLDRLLHFSKRAGKYTPIVSIDFMRQRAHATGACAGISDATFVGPPKTPTFAASVTVKRLVQGQPCDFTATARWTEYKPDPDFMWQKMPHLMLGKTAEALALRRAFPAELSGLFVSEELEQADLTTPPSSPRKVQRDDHAPISKAQQRKLFALARDKGWPTDVLKARLYEAFSIETSNDLRAGDFEQALDIVQRGPTPATEGAEEIG